MLDTISLGDRSGAGDDVRLTDLAHGGGCGCKLSPAVLRNLLAASPAAQSFPNLLVGTETGDDAAVYRLNETQALVATTDFFMPVVDDAHDFGRIAATNALSDVYAMGGTPIMALAIVGMPVGKLPTAAIRQILAGGASVCSAAGIPVAGGHSIDSVEPIYGLAVLGLVHPEKILRNDGARPGDALILTKGLGIGIFSAALKKSRLSAEDYGTMIASTTQLNTVGRQLVEIEAVHAVTDVTGFGLLGHTLEMCRGSAASARLDMDRVPVLPGAAELAREGIRTGASMRNWESYGEDIALGPELQDWQRDLLCDPQTSGGLLIAVAPEAAGRVLDLVRSEGFDRASIIGEMREGHPTIDIH